MDGLQEKLEEFLEEFQAKSFRKGKRWKEYDVYIPEYEDMVYVGLPLVLLVKGDEIRISTDQESMDYLEFENEDDRLKQKFETE